MARSVGMRTPPRQSGSTQGTPGGRGQATGTRPGRRPINVGDEIYLWLLILIEVSVMGALRQKLRRHHGG